MIGEWIVGDLKLIALPPQTKRIQTSLEYKSNFFQNMGR